MFIIEIIKSTYEIFIEIAPFLLLGLLFVGLLHILFSKEFMLKHIGQDRVSSTVKASLMGVPLPLCSCGVIPTAVYMAKNGASKGAVISFLISTPQTGIDSIIATYGMMGWVFAIYRPIIAFISGITGGIIVNLFSRENLSISVETEAQSHSHDKEDKPLIDDSCSCGDECSSEDGKPDGKLYELYRYAFKEFLDDISIHFLLGIILSGIISFYLPADFLVKYNLNNGIVAMLLMVIVGLPMYVCATASIPIAITLMLKGVSPGAAFVFLSVGPLTNAASLTILAKIFRKKTLIIYVLTSTILALGAGLLLDIIFNLFDFSIPAMMDGHNHSGLFLNYLYKISALVFALLMFMSFYRKIKSRFFSGKDKTEDKKTVEDINHIHLQVEGMKCNHCVDNITNSLLKLDTVNEVKINLEKKSAHIFGDKPDKKTISDIINNLGYSVVDKNKK